MKLKQACLALGLLLAGLCGLAAERPDAVVAKALAALETASRTFP